MSHLGERLSALVDGELGNADRERVLGHLARCQNCRFEADMLRAVKRRLRDLGPAEPSADFLGRLSAMTAPGTGPIDPPASGGFGSSPPLGSSRPVGSQWPGSFGRGARPSLAVDTTVPAEVDTARQRSVRAWPRWNRTRFAVAGASFVAVALSTAFMAGEEGASAPAVSPPLSDFAVEHAVVSKNASLPGPMTVPVPAPPAIPTDDASGRPGAADPR
ncbi:anti-sigma factor family protein [Nocardiopsis ansamitocini]|uniref:Putative zinc-finger domain-containing protein n=1 Tax=Nocardiopsis ansamitocini TaxID=1670832 RepID=A0A9W6P460_9ACTN|nr:anti-sigma factor [Nocardiopsis ansamitocini]GLU46783.1 hypothetical protein Nans01_11340 [Nocardiopsis ansamitocini]